MYIVTIVNLKTNEKIVVYDGNSEEKAYNIFATLHELLDDDLFVNMKEIK